MKGDYLSQITEGILTSDDQLERESWDPFTEKENTMQLGLNKMKPGESKEIRSHHMFARDIKANILKHGMDPNEFEIFPLRGTHDWGYTITRKGPEVPEEKTVIYHFNSDGDFIKELEKPFVEA